MSVRALIIAITMVLLSPITAFACPDVNQDPEQDVFGDYNYFFAAREFPVDAGGGYLLKNCFTGFKGGAHTTAQPNFDVNVDSLTDTQKLILRVESQCDVALLVYNVTNQTWQYDDNGNGNHEPLLLLSGEQGRQLVWAVRIGGPPMICDAILHVETM